MFWKRQANPKDTTDYSRLIMSMGKLVSEDSEISEEGLIAGLVKLGYSEKIARRAYTFVPICFGNDVLKKLGVRFSEDTYLFYLVPVRIH